MRPPLLAILSAILAGGCAVPSAPPPPPAPLDGAVEQARREERLKVMQAYWYDRTLSPAAEGAATAATPLLEYPAGTYSGITFGPRVAADPSLAEPDR
jgi:hypothetical protein